MLIGLEIKNYALIDHLKIDLKHGLSIVTGETGAGKSIILGALGLILANRADSQSLRDSTKKCIVEAFFDIRDYHLKSFFEDNDLDYFDDLIIRREIIPNGKSRAFINDSPTTLSILKELSSRLVSMHQQFDLLDIQKSSYQLSVVDSLAQNQAILAEYQSLYRSWKKDTIKLADLRLKNDQAAQERDFIQFQFDELEQADISNLNYDDLESKFSTLDNMEALITGSQEIIYTISEQDPSLLDNVRTLNRKLNQLSDLDSKLHKIAPLLEESITSLEEVSNQLSRYAEGLNGDEGQKINLEEKLNLINNLIQKHRINNFEGLIEIKNNLEEKLLKINTLDEEIKRLASVLTKKDKQLEKLAQELSKSRKKVCKPIANKIVEALAEIAMPHARLEIKQESGTARTLMGVDKIDFMFAANKGSELKLLSTVASGGEISRLTLCVKTLVADFLSLPTMIFDEIDTGVSGDVSLRMGKMLKKLSSGRQVLCITHSAQIAAQADHHFYIFKETNDKSTTTAMKGLDQNDRVQEIAKILSGDPPSSAAVENAKQLLNYN